MCKPVEESDAPEPGRKGTGPTTRASFQSIRGFARRALAVIYLLGFMFLPAPFPSAQELRSTPGSLQFQAERGDRVAQRRLAEKLERGTDGVRDERAAFEWYRRAAIAGDAAAQLRLGQLYAKNGDLAQADQWYRRAAGQGNAAALAALRARGLQTGAALSAGSPYAILRPAQATLNEIVRLDEEVRSLERLVLSALDGDDRTLEADFKAYIRAEDQLTKTLDQAWQSIAYTSKVPALISEPMRLAFIHLQVELRRSMGPVAATTVPDLRNEAGCQGDLIADKFLTRWGDAATELTSRDRSGTEEGLLGEFARHVACLSARQLAQLETGLSGGFFRVAKAMTDNNMTPLVPALARLSAPFQILVMDASKHRGIRSPSWIWFRGMHSALLRELNRSPWGATDVIYLWSRKNAVLLGYPVCRGQQPTPSGCVSVPTFLRSLADPRALALGDCALVAMVALGPTTIQGESFFACPAVPCSENADQPVDPNDVEKARQRLDALWPGFDTEPVLPGQASAALCRNSELADRDEPFSDDCIDAIFQHEPNPWDTFAACIVEGTATAPETFASFKGVPTGRKCGLFDGGGELPKEEQAQDPAAARDATQAGMDLPDDIPDFIEGLKQVIKAIFDFFSGGAGGATPGTNRAREDISLRLSDNTNQMQNEAKKKAEEGWKRGQFFHEGSIKQYLDQAMKDYSSGKIGFDEFQLRLGIAKEAARLIKERGGVIDCASPETCANTCTAIGAQLARANTCNKNLLDALAEAAGLPQREPEHGQTRKPIDIVVNYHPDDAPVDSSDIPACLVTGGMAPTRPPTGCALMHCGDVVSSPGIDGGCVCRTDLPALVLTPALCVQIDCGADKVLGSDCRCHPLGDDGSVPDWPQPGPDPAGSNGPPQ